MLLRCFTIVKLNSRAEILHRMMHNTLAKRVANNERFWDVHFDQKLAAIRFKENETTKFSSFNLIYNRDAKLPADNNLQPRRPYYRDEHPQIDFQEQHNAFARMTKNVPKVKKK